MEKLSDAFSVKSKDCREIRALNTQKYYKNQTPPNNMKSKDWTMGFLRWKKYPPLQTEGQSPFLRSQNPLTQAKEMNQLSKESLTQDKQAREGNHMQMRIL